MSNIIKPLYGTTGQTITCTVTSLANTILRSSVFLDQTSNPNFDDLFVVIAKTNASATSATGVVNVYVYGSVDGTNFTDGVAGTDSNFIPTNPTNLIPVGQINANANATTYVGGPFSPKAAFGGSMPAQWGVVVENLSGATLDASVGSVKHQGQQEQVI